MRLDLSQSFNSYFVDLDTDVTNLIDPPSNWPHPQYFRVSIAAAKSNKLVQTVPKSINYPINIVHSSDSGLRPNNPFGWLK